MHANKCVVAQLTSGLVALLFIVSYVNCATNDVNDNASVQLNSDQMRQLNELVQQYEQGIDSMAARKALAEAIVSRVVIDSMAKQRSPLESASELLGSNANLRDSSDLEIDPEKLFQAYYDSAATATTTANDNNELSAEKRAPIATSSSSSSNFPVRMGSAYLQPTSNAFSSKFKRPLTHAMLSKNAYDFGLGKRQSDAQFLTRFGDPTYAANSMQAASHQFGKRPSSHRFDFGLGKRKASYPRFDFGLGKRSMAV